MGEDGAAGIGAVQMAAMLFVMWVVVKVVLWEKATTAVG
jgi:hypothetical protein